jgi:hypothetical protein
MDTILIKEVLAKLEDLAWRLKRRGTWQAMPIRRDIAICRNISLSAQAALTESPQIMAGLRHPGAAVVNSAIL